MSKFCSNCGSQMRDEDISCGKCGTPARSAPVRYTPRLDCKMGVIIAGVLVILSTFFPYVSASAFGMSKSASLIEGDGVFFIVTVALAVVGVVINKQILTLIGGAATAILALVKVININKTMGEMGSLSGMVSKNFGFYLNILASIVLVVLSVMAFLASRKK